MKKQDIFKKTREDYILSAQKAAQDLLMRQDTITSEDVTKVRPLPKYLHHNTVGRIFQNPIFKAVGYTVARRPEARGHVIRIWSLNNSFYDERTLQRRWDKVRHVNDD